MKQVSLPFAEGEASHAERWNDLVIALSRIGRRCDCEMATFVRWVFNVTGGGTNGALQKSYAELAERPLGLCCSKGKARSTAETAERLGLVAVECRRRYDGAQLGNAYTIDWEGVRRLKLGGRTGVTTAHGGATTAHPHATGEHLFNEYKFLVNSSCSDTGPGAGPNPRMDSEDEGSRPRTAASGGRGDSLTESILADSPILAAARERRIAPLPADNLLHGVFAPIQPEDIHKLLKFVKWHRQQLSTAVPVMGDTEADLLLTLATVLYARSLPTSEVRKNRAAIFVSTIARREFLKSLPFVPKARTLLDEGIAKFGEAWAGLAVEGARGQGSEVREEREEVIAK